MKKVLKQLCFLPLFIIMIFAFFGCNEKKVEKIELSISQDIAIYEGGSNGYVIEYTTSLIKIDAKITPSDFDVSMLSWRSSATNVARVNNDGYLTCVGEGKTTIFASYNNPDGVVESRILVTITKEQLPEFANYNATTYYTGGDIKSNYKVNNPFENEEDFAYYYYDLKTGRQVTNIVNAGRYKITYCKVLEESTIEYAKMNLEVLPYQISITAPNGQSCYGDEIQDKFVKVVDESQIQDGGIDIYGGVGKDASYAIGKMLYTTEATNISSAGKYETNIEFVLGEAYKNNYEIKVVKGTYSVVAKPVIIVLNNQNITYGASPALNEFKLYDYNLYVENGNSIRGLSPLSSDKINYAVNISVPSYSLYLEDELISKNEWGYIDVGSYKITYDNTKVSSINNVAVKGVLSGDLNVEKKIVVVTPHGNLSKTYGTPDTNLVITYDAIGISNIKEIVPFLSVDYSTIVDVELDENNQNAPVGIYYYVINNLLNTNYDFQLVEQALPTWASEETRIVFTITPCIIELQFENLNENFSNPKSSSGHQINYYNDESADYIIELKSFKVNGVEQVTTEGTNCIDSDFDNNGLFSLETGELFRIKIRTAVNSNDTTHFASYKVLFDSVEMERGQSANLDFAKFTISHIYLNKILVVVTPNATLEQSQKIYDGSTSTVGTIDNFLKKYTLSNNFEGNLADVVVNTSTILSFKDKFGKYVIIGDNSQEIQVDSMIQVGKYKVFLSNTITFKEGMDYIDFVLDTSKTYYFEIKQCQVNIIVDTDQSKIYGEQDPEFTYIIDPATPIYESDRIKTGHLSREEGENIGNYLIKLGSLSYGSNYKLGISTNQTFEITKREVIVAPYSYITTYGDNYPSSISYDVNIIGSYDETILVAPQFEGEFVVTNNGTIVSKIGGYYPASYDTDGRLTNYSILQGTFRCVSDNYTLTFDNSSTYQVKPKDLIINIIPTNYNKETGEVTTPLSFTYELINLVGYPYKDIKAVDYESNSSVYYINDISQLNISISQDGYDLKSSYNIILGQNIIYYIDSTKIDFSIVCKDNNSSNSLQVTYSGNSFADKFTLLPQSGYEFITLEGGEKSNYSFEFTNSLGQNVDSPVDVGNYSVSLAINESSKFIVREIASGKIITLTNFGEMQDNYIATISKQGQLSISKADINVNTELLGFKSDLIYGSTEDELSDIVLEKDGVPVFTGVDGNTLTLRTFDNGKHYEYRTSSFPIEMLDVASALHQITVLIQAVKNVESETVIDVNYKPLTLEIPLKVTQRPIQITNEPTLQIEGGEEELAYNGSTRRLFLDVQMNNNNTNYTIMYNYILLDCIYQDSEFAKVRKHVNNDGVVSEVADDTGLITVENIARNAKNISIDTINGNNYLVIEEDSSVSYYLYKAGNSTPNNAGIYLCIATCSAKANYILNYNSKNLSDVKFYRVFEIKKSTQISISNWKDVFYYGTIFNINYKETLPFEFEMSPDFVDKVDYKVEDLTIWEAVNYKLSVGTYSINLGINQDNYYYSNPQTFEVRSCEAQIMFPGGDNRYIYNEGTPIESFKNEIYAILKDKDGNNVDGTPIKYTQYPERFSFRYFTEDGTSLEDKAPGDIGNYYVEVEYCKETDHYHGLGTYQYQISKQSYAGSIKASNKKIYYNPDYSAEYLFGVMNDMFTCDLEGSSYQLIISNVAGTQVYTDSDDSWVSSINDCSIPHTIKFTIKFRDGKTADRILTADLSVSKFKITSDTLTQESNIYEYSYSGYPVYKQLTFKMKDETESLPLIPRSTITSEKIVCGGRTYCLDYSISSTKTEYMISLSDALNNLMFKLKYEYFIKNSSGEYDALTGTFPVAPQNYSYKVIYSIAEVGSNYQVNVNLSEVEFLIKKIETLYIKVPNYDVTYTGNDFTNQNIVHVEDIIVKDSEQEQTSNLKFTVLYGKPEGAIRYDSSNGVFLIVRYKLDDEVIDSGVTNANKYKVIVSLVCCDTYEPSKYFNTVVFLSGSGGTSTYSTISMNKQPEQYIYSEHLETNFNVNPEKSLYSYDNIQELIEITKGKYQFGQVGETGQNGLTITNDGSYEIVDSLSNYYLEFYSKTGGNSYAKLSYSSFEELVVNDEEEYADYYFAVADSNGNYSPSSYILVRKLKATELTE